MTYNKVILELFSKNRLSNKEAKLNLIGEKNKLCKKGFQNQSYINNRIKKNN